METVVGLNDDLMSFFSSIHVRERMFFFICVGLFVFLLSFLFRFFYALSAWIF